MDCITSAYHLSPAIQTFVSLRPTSILSVLAISVFARSSRDREELNRVQESNRSATGNEPTTTPKPATQDSVERQLEELKAIPGSSGVEQARKRRTGQDIHWIIERA